jgi:hypothetical protein
MSKKLVIIAGGRTYSDKNRMREVILEERPSFIIEGDAPGADQLAGDLAQELGIEYIAVPALWNFLGKKAGSRRNVLMARILVALAGESEKKLIAFPGKIGTPLMVSIAEGLDIPVRKVDWE